MRGFAFDAPDHPDVDREAVVREHTARLRLGRPRQPDGATVFSHVWEPVSIEHLMIDGHQRFVSLRRHREHQRLSRLDYSDSDGARITAWFVDSERMASKEAADAELATREAATGRYCLGSPVLDMLSRSRPG